MSRRVTGKKLLTLSDVSLEGYINEAYTYNHGYQNLIELKNKQKIPDI